MKDLFGNEVIPQQTPDKKANQGAINAHKKLIQIYGEKENERCKDCDLLLKKEYAKTYYKCTKYKTGASINSDWRVGW